MSSETGRTRSGSADDRQANSAGDRDSRGSYGYDRRAHGSDPAAHYAFGTLKRGS